MIIFIIIYYKIDINFSHQNVTIIIIDKPTLTQHHPPKSIAYIRVTHGYTFYGFGQTYNGNVSPKTVCKIFSLP